MTGTLDGRLKKGRLVGYKDPEQRRRYQRKWKAARRAAFYEGKSCVQCGSTEELELDHIDPAAKITHLIWSWSAMRRDAELAKCQVLCCKCHLAKTIGERPSTTHGTAQMYQRYKCRCDVCVKFKRDSDKFYRSRKRQCAA